MPRLTFEYKITVANVIHIALIVVGGLWAYFTLIDDTSQASADLSVLRPAVDSLKETDATFNTRLTVVESRAETTNKRINDMVGSIDKLLGQITTDRTNTEEIARDVNYLRAWVESIKRDAKGSP
jgi:hypothetical protein